MTLSIICAFIGCWTPYFVVHLIHIWTEYRYVISESVYAFAETLALLNSAINPVLYGCFNVPAKSTVNVSNPFAGPESLYSARGTVRVSRVVGIGSGLVGLGC